MAVRARESLCRHGERRAEARNLFLTVTGFAIALALTGCGGLPAHVAGTVTVDGKPLENGTVAFYPVDGGPLASAKIEPDGSYTLRTASKSGLQTGNYVVTVNSFSGVPTPAMTPAEATKLSNVPRKYTNSRLSDLKYEVKKGNNNFAIELSSE